MHLASLLVGAALWDAQIVRWVVWVGLVVLTVALLLLVRTRWGQSQPLGKCVVLSLIAHLLLGIYTTTVNIVTATVGSPDGQGIQVALVDGTAAEASTTDTHEIDPWNTVSTAGPGEGLGAAAGLVPAASPAPLAPSIEPERQRTIEVAAPLVPIKPAEIPAADDAGPPVFAAKDAIARSPLRAAVPIEMPDIKESNAADVPPPDPAPPASPEKAGADKADGSSAGDKSGIQAGKRTRPRVLRVLDPPPLRARSPLTPPVGGAGEAAAIDGRGGAGSSKPVPSVYKQRIGDHLQAAQGRGATQESEARVAAALRWLAANQSPSGRWEARRLSGGAALAADREDRQGAGAQADTGITGLALLSFLAAGHTHLLGPHQPVVRRGLEFLLNSQDADGCLGSTRNAYERMYCHAMATCALSEAFAMTGDERLAAGVRRAIHYTLMAQDRTTGGWRYHPGDPGDTSQLGWQVMSLKSAELSGIEIPMATRDGIGRFLKSVATGRSGGLARYQPNRGAASRSMTAEALVCREFMALAQSPESTNEAAGFVLEELPGSGPANVYYWYYATLGLYQLQGEPWRRWNEALQKNLLATQRVEGDLAGSWDPDPVWGGCGGRAYSTAMSALCLEVYYRFLPLYVGTAARRSGAK